MRLPVPAGRKPSPRPRSGAGDPPDATEDADGATPSTEDAAHAPAVPATVSVTPGTETAVAEPDHATAGPPDSARSDSARSASDTGDDDTGDHTGDDTGGESDGRTATVAALLRPRRIIAALLVLAVLGGLGFAASAFFAQRAEDQARTEAVAAAKRYAVDLSSYDHQDLDGNFQAVERNATGEFGRQYRQVSDNLTQLLEQHQATSEGNVVRAGIAEATADRAVVLLFVDQTISNTNTEQPRVDRNRMEMTLLRRDDRWLVDNVTLL
ncbi:hypothetical protein [Prauserella alba]|uniref:Mce-associated membrane protein n=1 Tax=Prauserella alba TaxID=176898 RepID=A0ABN1V4V5_9PSEU|nr:hypothetical protein [Prauserella alba]MCP2180084.1 Mce-associated membrane protein [Prauserella alba]